MSGIVSKNGGRSSGIVGTGSIGADAVDGSNIADNAIDSEHYTDGSIDNAHIADNAIDSEHYADGSIDNAHIADDAIDSEHYADGSIDNAHIADDAIDSEHYADGSIDNAHIADNAIDSEHYAAASIDAEHLAVGKDGALSLNGAPADHTANGPQTTTFNAGYTTTQSDLVYLGSSSTWLEADSDAAGTSINLLGIALEVKDSGEALNVALPGSFIQDASVYSFTPGVPLYISGTLGAITATKPTGSGDIVRTVGYAVHADMIYFSPSSDYVTLA